MENTTSKSSLDPIGSLMEIIDQSYDDFYTHLDKFIDLSEQEQWAIIENHELSKIRG